MSVTVSYSHAAPFIRERLCRAAHNLVNAPTKRQESAALAELSAYAASLDILVSAGDYLDTDGIGNERYLPEDSIAHARDQLGSAFADRLGIVAATPDRPVLLDRANRE